MESREDGKSYLLAPRRPLSYADDPSLTPEGPAPAAPERRGWGWGGTALPAASTHRACAHTFKVGSRGRRRLGWSRGARGPPVPTAGTSRVPRLCGKRIEQSSAGRQAVRSHRCLAVPVGEGKRTGQGGPFPQPRPPGVRSQATAVPSPSASADNGRFTAGRRCWTRARRWEGGGVQPGPRSPPQVRPRPGGAQV